jgi:hypothetical protein
VDKRKDFKMSNIVYQNLINIEKWDQAMWRGIVFIIDQSYQKLPVIGILYEDGEVGKDIFIELVDRVGEGDEFDELRIAIVEGDMPGKAPGYSVHISSNPVNTIERARSEGIEINAELIVTGSRIHRMEPTPDSLNLPMFKDAYQRMGTYLVIPVSMKPDGIQPHFDHGIVKREIYFRYIDDLDEGDFDSIVLMSDDSYD